MQDDVVLRFNAAIAAIVRIVPNIHAHPAATLFSRCNGVVAPSAISIVVDEIAWRIAISTTTLPVHVATNLPIERAVGIEVLARPPSVSAYAVSVHATAPRRTGIVALSTVEIVVLQRTTLVSSVDPTAILTVRAFVLATAAAVPICWILADIFADFYFLIARLCRLVFAAQVPLPAGGAIAASAMKRIVQVVARIAGGAGFVAAAHPRVIAGATRAVVDAISAMLVRLLWNALAHAALLGRRAFGAACTAIVAIAAQVRTNAVAGVGPVIRTAIFTAVVAAHTNRTIRAFRAAGFEPVRVGKTLLCKSRTAQQSRTRIVAAAFFPRGRRPRAATGNVRRIANRIVRPAREGRQITPVADVSVVEPPDRHLGGHSWRGHVNLYP
jgi:hypothetical protein